MQYQAGACVVASADEDVLGELRAGAADADAALAALLGLLGAAPPGHQVSAQGLLALLLPVAGQVQQVAQAAALLDRRTALPP